MLETAHNQVTAKLEVSIGISSHPDPDIAIGEAAGSAGHRLGATVVDFAMVITAGPSARCVRFLDSMFRWRAVPPPRS